ncbi:MAG: long-chain acyl-CoA synthetase, partial [Acidobacteriaceae bacterium]
MQSEGVSRGTASCSTRFEKECTGRVTRAGRPRHTNGFSGIFPPRMPTFYDRFVECAERWPENVALEIQTPDGSESHTYAELRGMAQSFGAWLVAHGIEPGARIAILADNHPRWVAAYLGIIAAGGTAVPLDTAYHADQVAKLLADSGSSLLVCDHKHWDVALEAIDRAEVGIVLTDSGLGPDGQPGAAVPTQAVANFVKIFSQGSRDFKPIPRAPDDLASLLYTSGTTADPK